MLRIFLPALLLASAAAAAGADPDARAAAAEARMTDAQRLALLHTDLPIRIEKDKPAEVIPGAPLTPGYLRGFPELGVPDLVESDASLGVVNPFGLREGDVGTALPSSLALAASFDPELAYRSGAMIGAEARAKNFNVLLAPGVNLTRDPRNGRNFEYLGEDPLLAGILAGESARGIQSNGVVATIKHFALNAQESGRRFLDARIDEAALRESDLLAFEIGIERGQPGSVMCAYNQVNGAYSCGNDFLLNKVLKGDWGYPGWVMSDWGAVHDVGYLNAGLDQQSGAQLDGTVWYDAPLKAELAAGRVKKDRIADAVHRILRSVYATGADWQPTAAPAPIDYAAHAQVARAVEAAGIVLLKNDGALPLASTLKSVAVIGGYANVGVMSGGGSSQVLPVGGAAGVIPMEVHHLVKKPLGQLLVPSPPFDALKAARPGTAFEYDAGYDVAQAAALAARKEMAIVFVTRWQSEGFDAGDLVLPGDQDRLIAAIARANPNTVVVLETGNPVLMPWLGAVKAVIEAWYPGQAGGSAIADVLSGAVNPSGRLPMSFPADETQTPRPQLPGFDGKATALTVDYSEGADVGYRWFAAHGARPLFPFGYGLSYTRFEHGALRFSAAGALVAQFTVRNTGAREGADVAQLYLVSAAGRPVKRLVGFQRVALKPGESRSLSLQPDARLLADWEDHGWHLRGGEYRFALGRSADDLGPPASVPLAELRLKP